MTVGGGGGGGGEGMSAMSDWVSRSTLGVSVSATFAASACAGAGTGWLPARAEGSQGFKERLPAWLRMSMCRQWALPDWQWAWHGTGAQQILPSGSAGRGVDASERDSQRCEATLLRLELLSGVGSC